LIESPCELVVFHDDGGDGDGAPYKSHDYGEMGGDDLMNLTDHLTPVFSFIIYNIYGKITFDINTTLPHPHEPAPPPATS